MRLTMEGLALIKEFEGCSLKSYQDQGGIWTIGWGCTRAVGPHMTITQAEADDRLMTDVRFAEQLVLESVDHGNAISALTDNAISALTSFVYNVGLGKEGIKSGFFELKSGGPSTLLRKVWAKDLAGAAAEFPKWNKINGMESAGLLRRRLAEQALFVK